MRRGTHRRGARAWSLVRAMARAALVAATCGFAVGCITPGPAMLGGPGASTVAFESIDGPPETVFRKLVGQLTQEANAHQVAVVSRESPAQYRIRSYVAAHVQGKRTTIAWVWDIYTADRERAMRLAGEVPGASQERAWSAADDQAIGRIARDGMDRLATFLANPRPAPGDFSPPPAADPGPNVAFAPGVEGALAFPTSGRP
jgi:hypothetical protein